MNSPKAWASRIAALSLVLATVRPAAATNGHVLHGVGAINQSLGGAGIATSLDVIGANGNNVSSIAYLDGNSIAFNAEVFIPDRSMTASFGPIGGTVDSATREAVIPGFGIAYHIDDEWTVGFTGLGIGGFGVDYPANSANASGNFNPLALPQPAGFGAIYSNYNLLQLTPSVAWKILPNVAIGVGGNVNWSSLSADPFPATPPDASGYPDATHTASAWGAGFTAGVTYKPIDELALGAVIKSPQWFNSFRWHGQYPDGAPASFGYRLNYPMIIGVGGAYTPLPEWLVASDVKWINYAGTDGFGQKNFATSPTGPYVRGLGWENIWTFSLGVQYKVVPRVPLRIGYNFGQNPIPSNQQFINAFAPAIVQHHLTLGFGVDVTSALQLNVAYYHAFQNSESGPFLSNGSPAYGPINQPIPGSKITNRLSENSVSLEVAVKF